MTDLNPLRQFLSAWFVDADGPGGDEAAARRFAQSAGPEDIQAVLDEAELLISGEGAALVETLDREANRYFDSVAEARAWLAGICEAIRQEPSA